MEWFMENWQTILTVIFGLGLVYAGLKIKSILKELYDLTNAFNDFMGTLYQASADDKLTKEEWDKIRESWNKVMLEAKDIGGIILGVAKIVARIMRK